MRGLAISEVAEQTGLTTQTIRAWESRYGFPMPDRTPSGYRVYGPEDVEVLQRVAQLRRSGVSVAAALEQAKARPPSSPVVPSFFGVVPHDGRARTLRKSTLTALSRAIEDGAMAATGQPIVLGAFQREHNFRRVEHRYKRLAATSEMAVVFADFAELRDEPGRPVEVPIPQDQAAAHEWAVVVDGGSFAVCLVAWEPPVKDPPPRDADRRFEAYWTLDPEAVRRSTLAGIAVAAEGAPAVAERLRAKVDAAPLGPEPRIETLEGLTQRMVAYLETG